MAKRQRPETGYYYGLHTRSTADYLSSDCHPRRKRLQLREFEDSLPQGVFKVERLVTHRNVKVDLQYNMHAFVKSVRSFMVTTYSLAVQNT